MGHFAKSNQYAMLALLAILTGCTLPPVGHDGKTVVCKSTSAVMAANPTPPFSVNVAEIQPSSPASSTTSQVSYQASADTAPAPPKANNEPASLPEGISPGPVQPVPATDESKEGIAEPLAASPQSAYRSDDPCDPFNGLAELSVEQLVAEVQARNPSLQAASAAWRAATERYPQVVSLDDPMFVSMIGPKGVGMDNGGGWMVEASQKIPWAGKRTLRGSAASADADAMKGDIGDVRLRLSEAARTAFYDYYLARRVAEVNASTRRLVTQYREIAWNKYQVNQTTQQDVLQADVELATLESRRTELTRDEQVAIARINTLLHRAADHPLPPPPAKAPLPDSLPGAESLQKAAESRPDLFAMQARIRAEQANVALACKEYYPDLNLVAKYDGFMPEEMRPQVGMEFNVPLQRGRRSAAVREASERLQQRCAEYQERLDQVRYEVQAALDRAAQSQQVIRLYEDKLLPATQRSVESAQSNYTSGKLDFLRLIDAERQVYTQREMYYQAIAEYNRRLAELERVVGGSLPEAIDVR
jgi:cobalt-zinc-cadmium efflux system outer membrane protein